MPPAARQGDIQTCPLADPGPIPHVGGPILGGAGTVILEGRSAARVGDATHCAPVLKVPLLISGCPTVSIVGALAARVGDATAHGGVIATGAGTVMIGDLGPPTPEPSP